MMKEAIEEVEAALDAWMKGREVVKRGTMADKRDLSRRLMNLDEAVMRLEHFAGTAEADEALLRAHSAMMGVAA